MAELDGAGGPNAPDDQGDAREDAAIAAIAGLLAESVRRTAAGGALARRDAHPKHHAIVRAEFQVDPDVPADFRHGVLAAVRRYPAWIRLSNGSPRIQADRRRDQRGLAIKLLEVPGAKLLAKEADAPTQDFVLASHSRFFIRSVHDYAAFTRAASRGKAGMLSFFFQGPPWRWRIHELRALLQSLERTEDILALRYWSQTPFALGPHVVKYGLRPMPVEGRTERERGGAGHDFLRARLAARLNRGPARFAFLVQRRTDPASMPIEDATVEWDEARAPFVKVATITIPAQQFDSAAQMALAEQIAFTPWHALPEHRPLGGVNRTRRVVYETVSRLRHELNGVHRREPVSLTLDDSQDAAERPGDAGGH